MPSAPHFRFISGVLSTVTIRPVPCLLRTESVRTEASISEKDSIASDEEEEEEEILGSDDDEQEAPSDYKPGESADP